MVPSPFFGRHRRRRLGPKNSRGSPASRGSVPRESPWSRDEIVEREPACHEATSPEPEEVGFRPLYSRRQPGRKLKKKRRIASHGRQSGLTSELPVRPNCPSSSGPRAAWAHEGHTHRLL